MSSPRYICLTCFNEFKTDPTGPHERLPVQGVPSAQCIGRVKPYSMPHDLVAPIKRIVETRLKNILELKDLTGSKKDGARVREKKLRYENEELLVQLRALKTKQEANNSRRVRFDSVLDDKRKAFREECQEEYARNRIEQERLQRIAELENRFAALVDRTVPCLAAQRHMAEEENWDAEYWLSILTTRARGHLVSLVSESSVTCVWCNQKVGTSGSFPILTINEHERTDIDPISGSKTCANSMWALSKADCCWLLLCNRRIWDRTYSSTPTRPSNFGSGAEGASNIANRFSP